MTVAVTRCAEMRGARMGLGAVELPDGRVLVAGGASASGGSMVASCEVYEPATDTWRVATRLGVPRQDLALTVLADGRVLAAGGRLGDRRPLAVVEAWDPGTDRWTRLADLAEPVWGALIAPFDDDRAVLLGGFGPAGPSRRAWWIDRRSGAIHEAPQPADDHAYPAAAGGHGALVVADLGGELLTDAGWRPLPARPAGGADAAAITSLADGGFLIAGGRDAEDEHARADTMVWSRDLTRVESEARLGEGRWGLSLLAGRAGRVIAAGGVTGEPLRFAACWEVYDPAQARWSALPLSEPRWRHAHVALTDGSHLLLGGAATTSSRAIAPGATPAVSRVRDG